ncbi:hypothetical protein N7G274_005773 [Stereocaulon virgatum]|uniref:Uncharacterized protein n=1 Tax=Stereocaulon virgatum TaxID=373712 RepID=A0ABR4A914_9LECA
MTQKKYEWQQSESQPRRTLLNNFGAAGSKVALFLEAETEPRTYDDVDKRQTLSLNLSTNPEALPDGVIIHNRRACLESRDYQSSPLDDLVETNDDGVLKSSEADYWGFIDGLVYKGNFSRGSILKFLWSVMFMWPNKIE